MKKKVLLLAIAIICLWCGNADAQLRVKTNSWQFSGSFGSVAMFGNQQPNLLSWRAGLDIRHSFNPMLSVGIGTSYDHIQGPKTERNTYTNLVGFKLNSLNVYSTVRFNLNEMGGGSTTSDFKLFLGLGGGVRMSLMNEPYDLTGDKIVWSSEGEKYSFGLIEAGGSFNLSDSFALGIVFQGQSYRGEDDLPNRVVNSAINERDGRTFILSGQISAVYTISGKLYTKSSRPKKRGAILKKVNRIRLTFLRIIEKWIYLPRGRFKLSLLDFFLE